MTEHESQSPVDASPRGGRWTGLWTVLGLLAAVVLVHHKLLLRAGGAPLYTVRWDAWQFMWPRWVYLADSLRAGIWPLWDPYTFAGTPLFNNLQLLYFNPLVLIFAALTGFNIAVMPVYLFCVYVVGAIGMYVLARECAVERRLAIALGLLFTVSGFALGNAQHLPQLNLFVMEPAALAMSLRTIRHGSLQAHALLALATAWLISGGYPSLLGHCLLFNGLFAISLLPWTEWRISGQKLLQLGGTYMAALAIMSPMWVPAFLSLPTITRGGGVSYDVYTANSLPFPYLLSVVNPLAALAYIRDANIDLTLKNCSVGIPIVAAVLVALRFPRGRLFPLAYLLLCLCGMLGRHALIAHLFYALPLLGNSCYVTYEFRALFIVIAFMLACQVLATLDRADIRRHFAVAIGTVAALSLIATATWLLRMNMGAIQDSITDFTGWTVPAGALKLCLLVIPVALAAGYAVLMLRPTAFRRYLIPWVVCEALLTLAFNFYTVAAPVNLAAGGEWKTLSAAMSNRPLGFPLPNPFRRALVFPKQDSMGCVYKVHTDWGYDGTVLNTIDRLIRSERRDLLYGPYLFTLDAAGTQMDIPIHFDAYGPNHVHIRFAPLSAAAQVQINTMYYSGWTAESGETARDCRASSNGFIEVTLQPGDTDLSLTFAPRGLPWLFTLGGLTLAATVVATGMNKRRPTPVV